MIEGMGLIVLVQTYPRRRVAAMFRLIPEKDAGAENPCPVQNSAEN
jgi:hypothetical protein